MIFLGLFIFFVCMFAYLRHKSTAAEEAAAESFWNRENEANHTRRKDISGLPYITIPLADFPMGIYDNPELKKYEETLQSLAGQKILNLGGKTNTDLQLDQSRPHLTDQRNLLIRQKIGRYLKMEVGHAIIMFD